MAGNSYPETAVTRMRWARAAAFLAFRRFGTGARPVCAFSRVARRRSAAGRCADIRLTKYGAA